MDGGASMAEMTRPACVACKSRRAQARLCRKGSKGRALIQLSSFLAQCHRILKTQTYGAVRHQLCRSIGEWKGEMRPRATPWQCGGIYAADNFKYLGKVPAGRPLQG